MTGSAVSWFSSSVWESLSYIGVPVLKASGKSTPNPHQAKMEAVELLNT